MGGGAGWPRERTTSLYYKKMLVGSRESTRMSGERTVDGAGGFQLCLVQHLHMRTEARGNHCCPGVMDTGAMAPVTSPCRSGYIGGLVCH